MSIQPIAHKIVKKIIQFYSKRRQVKPPDLLKEKKTLRLAYIISGGVGDAIMAFPALQKLKYLLPDSLLSVYVPSRKLELIQALFSEYKVLPFRTGYRGLSDLLFCRNVSDMVFTNTTSVFRVSVEIAAYFRGRTSCGFRYAEENEKSRLYTVSQPYSDTMHEVEQNLSLVVRTLNAAYDADDIFYPSFPESAPLPARGNGIVIHAGSKQGYEKKRWPVENYCALVKMLALKGYTSAVLIGPEDLALAERFKKEGVLTMPSSSAII
jgi:ADP-heptose:LPS heptosyltransferase